MPSFYCIHEGFYEGIEERLSRLKNACINNNVIFVDVDSLHFNYCKIPVLNAKDLLYNVARGGEIIESLLIQPHVRTFYVENPTIIENNGDTTKYSILHDKLDFPTPLTIFQCPSDKVNIKKMIEHLGGFPVVLKTTGGTKGVGTIFINDYPSLFSVSDFLRQSNIPFITREYIAPSEVARLIVVGDEVVASNHKLIPPDDFRTSVDHQLPIPKKYSKEIEQLAVLASHSVNFENCGVDILIDNRGNPYILEVNMPHDFVTTEKVTNIDIAEKMIQHLLSK